MSDPLYLKSKLGIFFIPETITSMRRFAEVLPRHENNVLLWGVIQDNGHFKIGLGAGHAPKHPDPAAIKDEVDGVTFYWCARQENLDLVRENYYVDFKPGEKSRLTLLSKKEE